jgi:hypothetical protein
MWTQGFHVPLAALLCLTAISPANAASMEPCPEPDRDDKPALRSLAKKWFEKGEQSSKDRDDVNAIRAFQCSLSFVPHGFTAFNLAEVAERVGDLDLAITNYETYITLVPEAEDKSEVEQRIVTLKERLQKAMAASKLLTDKKDPPPTVLVPSPVSQPVPANPPVTAPPVPEAPHASWYRSSTVAYVTAGVGVALLGTGIALNVASRSKMDESFKKWDAWDDSGSRSSRSTAVTYAYSSYALFAVGGAALVGGITLLLLPTPSPPVEVSLLPGGGASLSFAGRF